MMLSASRTTKKISSPTCLTAYQLVDHYKLLQTFSKNNWTITLQKSHLPLCCWDSNRFLWC